jgi:7-cyano-7-deazaguanine synthase
MDKRKAVVLLSGGLDSATVLAMAVAEGYECYALTLRYGQRHGLETEAASRIARRLGAVECRQVDIDLSAFGGSVLTDPAAEVPKEAPDLGAAGRVPATYVPARNLVFLSVALSWAEALGAFDIFIGANCVDYAGYPDCRPRFIEAFEKAANLAAAAAAVGGGRYRVRAPVIGMTKGQIIRTGLQLGVDYSMTVSCYDPGPSGRACGRCDSCRLRLKGFKEVGIEDPVQYQVD